jgi:ammonium transporter, Amt family
MADAGLTVPLALVVAVASLSALLAASPRGRRAAPLAAAAVGAGLAAVAGAVGLGTGDAAEAAAGVLLLPAGGVIAAGAAVLLGPLRLTTGRTVALAAAWSLLAVGPLALGLFSARRPFLLQYAGVLDFGGALAAIVPLGVLGLAVRVVAGRAPEPPARPLAVTLLVWVAAAAWLVAVELRLDEGTPGILAGALLTPPAAALGWLVVQRTARARTSRAALAAGLAAGVAVGLGAAPYLDPEWLVVVGLVAGAAGSAVVDPALSGARVLAGATVVPAVIGVLSLGVFADARGLVFVGGLDGIGAQLAGCGVALVWSAAVSLALVRLARRGDRPVAASRRAAVAARRASRPPAARPSGGDGTV